MGLNSRQSGGGDLPSLDLAFALDKTLTARKGPIPAFTRSSTATFVGSNGLIQSAIIDAPRFDHDPVTGLCKGLLIEESRENRILRSEEFEHSNWVKTNISVSQDSIIAPNGLSTADLLQSVATSSSNVFASSVATATAVTYSIYTKKGNVATRFFLLRNSTTATNFQLGTINYDTATISGAGWTIQTLPNGWYRIAFTQSTGITLGDTLLAYCGMKGDIDTAGSTWSVWGAQLEAGAFPLSYIPTTSDTAARSADVCSIAGDDFSSFYNQSEGTIFARYSVVAGFSITGRTVPVCAISNQSFNEAIRIGSPTSNLNMAFDTVASSIQTRILATSPISLIGSNTAAGAYKINDSGFSSNSATTLSGSPASITTLVNRFDIGGLHPGSAVLPLNGHIARIQYFRKRLSNAKLQTITAP